MKETENCFRYTIRLGKKENDFFKSIRQKQLTIYVFWDRKCQSCDLIDDKQYRPKKPSRKLRVSRP